MSHIASEKRMQVVIGATVAILVLAVLGISASSYAVGGAASSSSSSAASSTAGASSSSSKSGSGSSSSHAAVEKALSQSAVPSATADAVDTDSAGTLFTFTTPLDGVFVGGDLYWAGQNLDLNKSKVANDVLGVGVFSLDMTDSDVGNDMRIAGQKVHLTHVIAQDFVNILAMDAVIDEASAAKGYYCGGGAISYSGTSERFIAYGQSIYFDGVVEGDVTLSAQDIVIGPHAKVTGTMDVRSGQTVEVLDIPESAQIARIDTTLNQPNTIDQITQIRAAIAPYFQVGTMLFLVASFIILGLVMRWSFGNKMSEANRLIRTYPLAVVVLGCIALMLMFVVVMLGTLLVFTIPLSAVTVLALLVAAICCIPFTGSSLMLMLRKRIRPWLCVVLGSGIGAVLVFVPVVNAVVFACSFLYFVGYLVNIAMFGHDERHDAAFHRRQIQGEPPAGLTSGILPVNEYAPVSIPVARDDAGVGEMASGDDASASGEGEGPDAAGAGEADAAPAAAGDAEAPAKGETDGASDAGDAGDGRAESAGGTR